jgi:hypothetical protein
MNLAEKKTARQQECRAVSFNTSELFQYLVARLIKLNHFLIC